MPSASGEPDGPTSRAEQRAWEKMIAEAGPASLIVYAQSRLGPALREHVTAEDVVQEALLQAWRGRDHHVWRGPRAFRAWLVQIIEHRLADLADHFNARKRGGKGIGPAAAESPHAPRPQPLLPAADPPSTTSAPAPVKPHAARRAAGQAPEPATDRTPSRVAMFREEADAMREVLDALPDDVREVVRLRLLHHITIEEIARRTGLGVSAVRRRLERGEADFTRALRARLRTGTRA
jgi:RNA polymerase sigma factor (sigma-70 family)